MLPVGLYEWKMTTAHPILTIMFKNILRILEAEILNYLRTFSCIPKLDVLIKKRVYSLVLQPNKRFDLSQQEFSPLIQGSSNLAIRLNHCNYCFACKWLFVNFIL